VTGRGLGELSPVIGSGVRLSTLGAGTSSLGDVFGPVDEAAAVGVVGACLANQVRYLDTAPLYGSGTSERRLGRALADLGQPDLVISTKVGRTLDASAPDGWRFDFSREAILRGLDSSLTRLGRDSVDIVYVHDPDDHEREVYREAWPALVELRDQGVVRAIGFGMNQWQMPLRFVERLDVDVVMLAGRYTLLDTSADREFLSTCIERKVAVVLAGVFNSGILANPVDGAWFNYQPASPELLYRARRMRDVAEFHGSTLAAIALQFALGHPAASSVVVGVGSAANLKRNVDAANSPVPTGLWEQLVSENLIAG
jgi:D-threo-aldose 1-dehydrogenase